MDILAKPPPIFHSSPATMAGEARNPGGTSLLWTLVMTRKQPWIASHAKLRSF